MEKQYTREEVEAALKGAESVSDVVRALGLRVTSGNYATVRGLARKYNLTLPVWDNRKSAKYAHSATRLSDEEFFAKDTHRKGPSIRKRLTSQGKKYTCDNPTCLLHGSTEWDGKPLTFQVDHIDGDKYNNLKENLRFLCPNCHSQTRTYSGANRRKDRVQCLCGRAKVKNEGEPEGHCPHQEGDPLENPALGTKAPCRCGENERSRGSVECRSCAAKSGKFNGAAFRKTWPEKKPRPKRKRKRGRTAEEARKDREVISWPTLEELISLIEEKGYLASSRELGVSDNAIRKRLKARGVDPLPKKRRKESK